MYLLKWLIIIIIVFLPQLKKSVAKASLQAPRFQWHGSPGLLRWLQKKPRGGYQALEQNDAWKFLIYPLVNKQLDPENHQFSEETNLPTPIYQGPTVNLLEGIILITQLEEIVYFGRSDS